MKTKALSVIIAALTLLTVSVNMQAQNKKYYVSTGGNDANGGSTGYLHFVPWIMPSTMPKMATLSL